MTPTLRRYGLVAALVGAVAALFTVLSAAPALAHTELRESTPAQGASVAAPTEVTLVFSDRLAAPFVKVNVLGPGGREVQVGMPEVTGATVTQQVQPMLAASDYTIGYRVVSADGHPVTGEVPFSVKEQAEESAPPAQTPAQTPASTQPPAQSPASTASSAEDDGALQWTMVLGGLAVGIAIGAGLFFWRTRKAP